MKLLSEEENVKNKIWQQTRLHEYLNEMPVSQILIEGIEADDIIAQICNEMYVGDYEKVIVSSDCTVVEDLVFIINRNTRVPVPYLS